MAISAVSGEETVSMSPMMKQLVGAVFLIGVLGLTGYFIAWRWLVVKKIQCFGQGTYKVWEVCAPATVLKNQPLLLLDINDSRWSDLKVIQDDQQTWWYLTSWVKRLPDTVILRYTQSKPVYQISQADQTWWLVNEAGLAQTLASASGQLTVAVPASWSSPLVSDLRVDAQLHKWVRDVQKAAQTQPEPLQRISLIDQFTVELQWPQWTAVLALDQNPDQQFTRLGQVQDTLTEKTKILGKDFHRVDLRFRLPVLSN